jgi:NADPH:quinone reductase-like Zn-dependent oxidoreductase
MAKRLEIIGTMLRNRSMLEKAAATKAFQDEVLPKFVAGELRPIIDKTFPLEKAAEAYDYMAADKNFGKIVLSIG